MPTEAELREQFHDDDRGPDGGIDLDAVLRRSRARRRPRAIAVAAASSLAVLAVLIPVGVSGVLGVPRVVSAGSGSSVSGAEDSGAKGSSGSEAPQSFADGGTGSGIAPADKVNLCTGTLADLAPAADGLVLTVEPISAAATDRDIPATVTLTNTGSTAFEGSASPYPALTLSRDGIVLWHSNGAVPSLAAVISLAPGASMTFAATFQPVVCGIADDEATSFRDGLPAAGSGSYGLSAVLDVSSDDGTSALVGGPVAAVTLR